jgi:hypothetical protein
MIAPFLKFWRKYWLRIIGWAFSSLIILYLLLCAWVNHYGARHWRELQSMLKAEGETLDFRQTVRPPVPDATNFGAIPALADGPKFEHLNPLKLTPAKAGAGAPPRLGAGPTLAVASDLVAWASWLRKAHPSAAISSGNPAKDLLTMMSNQDAMVQELATNLGRSEAQWTPSWQTRELPPMIMSASHQSPDFTIQHIRQSLILRAIAAARSGNATKAVEAIRIVTKLDEASLREPFLIGMLFSATASHQSAIAVWELCDARAGNVDDYAQVELALSQLDYRQSGLQACRTEMAGAVNALLVMRNEPGQGDGATAIPEESQESAASRIFNRALHHLIPRGFYDYSAASLVQFQFQSVIKPLRDQGWMPTLRSAQAAEARLALQSHEIWYHFDITFTALAAPTHCRVLLNFAHSQCVVDQATIACALERHRLAKGDYPETLQGLALANGKALPNDALTGGAMGYRRTSPGKYRLWCVGIDGEDDGGRRVIDRTTPNATKFSDPIYRGDWVWDYGAAP